jgi:putative tryptophan/tyrosine transport system substrate-binding protein
MRRREFIGLLGARAAFPAPAWGQQRAHPTIGILYNQTPEVEEDFMPAFYRGLSELGYTVGNNLAIEVSSADGHPERQPALAAEMVRRDVSLIIAQTGVFAKGQGGDADHSNHFHGRSRSRCQWPRR